MGFTKYGEIESILRQKNLDYIFQEGLGGGEWRVSEKVHGSA